MTAHDQPMLKIVGTGATVYAVPIPNGTVLNVVVGKQHITTIKISICFKTTTSEVFAAFLHKSVVHIFGRQ